MNKKGALISIDILRAIAALGVFLYHQHIGTLIAKYTRIAAFTAIDEFGAKYAVPLFFLISGYCIHLSNIKYLRRQLGLPLKEYYKRRLLRIYPAYFIALLFAIAVNYFTYHTAASLTDIAVHLFSLQGFTNQYFNSINVVLWTISVEIAFYIIYPAFYYTRLKYSLNRALLLVLLVSTISIIFFSLKTNLLLNERFCVFNLWFAWCCGAYIADKNAFDPKGLKKPVPIVIYLIIIAGFIAIHVIPNNLPIIYDQLDILMWIGPVLFVISKEGWLNKHYNRATRILAGIGLSSYSLYLLHQPLIILKIFIVHNYLPAKFQLAGLVGGIFVIPLIAWFSFVYIEKPFTVRKAVGHAS